MLLQFVTFFADHLPVGLLPCSFSLSVHLILSTPSLTPQRQPHARASSHSLISFLFAHFTPGVYVLFPPCKSMWLQPGSASLHPASPPRTYTPYRLFAAIHSIRSLRPALAFSTRNVQAKKCAKLAAGSTLPPRSALPVSGALAQLALARTQRTGFILRFVSLHSHLSLAIHAGSRLFLHSV